MGFDHLRAAVMLQLHFGDVLSCTVHVHECGRDAMCDDLDVLKPPREVRGHTLGGSALMIANSWALGRQL
jgi:hypothetical protein